MGRPSRKSWTLFVLYTRRSLHIHPGELGLVLWIAAVGGSTA